MTAPDERGDAVSVPDLPEDIFLVILRDLDPWDVVRCQKVSRAWRDAFTQDIYIREVLKKYKNAREVRDCAAQQQPTEGAWKDVCGRVASRYYHLDHGKARTVTRHKLRPLDQLGNWFPVGQWNYHESQPNGRLYYENAATHLNRLGNKPYLFRPTLWSYDDGLIVCALLGVDGVDGCEGNHYALSILDLESNQACPVPFNIENRVVRGIRLRNRALVIEWAEKDPFHDLNDSEKVHRHFATCFDVVHSAEAWHVTFRSEWKMHFLGLPLNQRDRFFSTHNGHHYAVYFWQPNRSMYTGDEDLPIETLCVWDISVPSPYQPSLDPSGKKRPSEDARPYCVTALSFRELDFLGVRQHGYIAFMGMELDSEACTLSFNENEFLSGMGYFDPAERLLCAKTTTFPFRGLGAAHHQRWNGNLPPYRGHCSMESARNEEPEKWFFNVMDVHDSIADVRFSLVETCFTGASARNGLLVRVNSLSRWTTLDDHLATDIASMGYMAGDERWLIGQSTSMELVVLTF